MNEGGSTYIRIWSKLFIDFVPCNFLRDINMQKESNVHHHLCFCHFHPNQKNLRKNQKNPNLLENQKNPNLLETQKIWTCLKVVLGTERWTCPYSLIFCWRLTIHCQHFFFEIKIWNVEESWYDDYLCLWFWAWSSKIRRQEVLFISICILEKYFKKIQEKKEGK